MNKKKIFAPPVDEFIELYDKFQSSRKMGKYYNVDKGTIIRYAKQVGYDYKKNIKIIPEDIKLEICEKYYTYDSAQLAKEYKLSRGIITKIWHDANLLGKDIRKYTYNYEYFNQIDTKDKAYFLGWLASDGCVYKRPNSNCKSMINLCIDAKDEAILKTFCKYINRDLSLTYTYHTTPVSKETKKTAVLQLVGNELYEDLQKYNIIPCKTYNYKMVELAEELMSHFFRGYFDGDGYIGYSNNIITSPSQYKVTISGFEHNLQKMKEYLSSQNIESIITIDKRKYDSSNKFGVLTFSNIQNKYKFLNYIYNDIDDLYLARKKYLYDCFMTAIKYNYSNKANIYNKFIS